jgi:hypothetical protein
MRAKKQKPEVGDGVFEIALGEQMLRFERARFSG